MEKFKTIAIPGLEKYQVSNLGRIKSFVRKKTKILKPGKCERGYYRFKLNGKNFLLHRLVMITFRGQRIGLEVDHIDGDKSNNKLSNLRYCTRSENLHNRSARTTKSSKFKGVSLCKFTGKYRVSIQVNKTYYWLGRFKSEIEAKKAYDKAFQAMMPAGNIAR